jgi:hypothetical protein
LKGQCSPSTWGKIQSEAGFDAIDAAKNAIELKRRIKGVCCGFERHKQPVYALAQAIVLLATTFQEANESLDTYFRNFKARWDMLEQFGGSLGYQPGLIEDRAREIAAADGGRVNILDDDREAATEQINEEMKASLMLVLANRGRFETLRDDLANKYVLGDDKYPTSVDGLMGVLRNYKPPKGATARPPRDARAAGSEGLQFVQKDEEEKTDEGAIMAQEKKVLAQDKKKYNSKGESHCYGCGAGDHWADDCPEKEKRGGLFLQTDGAMISQFRDGNDAMVKTGGLRPSYLYLDTCTTNDQMVNPCYLTGVHTAEIPLRLHTNAGTSISKQQGYLGSQKFWLDRMGIANVISLKSLEEKYRVTYDSKSSGGSFVVHTANGPVEFKRCPVTSFPYIDLDDVSQGDKGAMLVQTVRGNYEGFTKREVQKAREMRTLQGRLGHLSETELKGLLKDKEKVSHALLKNSNLTIDDLDNSRVIYGPSVPRLKGTSVRHKSIRAEPNFVRIPREIIDMNRYVTLVADVMFVCGLPFLISLSRRIRFVTVEFIPKRTAGELSNGLKNILKLYNRAGFIIQCACMDNEFEPLKKKLLGKLVVNTTAADEHVGEIERKIQHVKTRARSLKASLPFKKLPNAVIKAMIYNVTMWMNALVSKQGVSDIYSPRELLLRTQLDVDTHAKATFGSYCEAYSRPKQTNSQEERTTSCICLGPTGNFQGTYKFLNLNTGEVIKRAEFTELPMPDSVIKKVEFWADRDKQEARDSLSFRNRNNERFTWDDDLEDEPLIEDNAPEPPAAPFPDIPAEPPGIDLERDETPAVAPDDEPTLEHRLRLANANADLNPNLISDSFENDRSGNTYHNNNYIYNVQNNQRNIANVQNNVVIAEEGEIEEAEANEDEVPGLVYRDDSSDDEDDDDYVPSEQEDVELEAEEELEDYRSADDGEETVRRSRSGRQIKERKYYHDEYQFLQSRGKWAEANAIELCIAEAEASNEGIDFIDKDPIELYDGEEAIFGSIMMQLSLKAGLKKWGKKGEESAMKEMTQLHDMQAFFPRDPNTMTQEQRKKALSSLIFLKEKSTGEIKSRTCINGAPQRDYISKEDAASPTASTDSVFMVGAINAHEKRDVVTADLPGAFLNTVTDELVFMVLKGELCELMVRVNPKIYRRYVTADKKGNPVQVHVRTFEISTVILQEAQKGA